MKRRMAQFAALFLITGVISLALATIIYAYCIKRDTGQNNGQLLCCDGNREWWHPNTLPVPITINESGSKQAPGARTIDAVRRAMQTWNQVNSSFFEFSDGGLTSQDRPSSRDEINIIVFDTAGVNFEEGSQALAFSRTITTRDNLGYRAIDSDMVFNARDFQFTDNPSGNQFDIESITLHEFGHHLGLSHAGGSRDTGVTDRGSAGCGPPISNAVMWFAIAQGSRQRTLHSDDIAGITDIYPKWEVDGVVLNTATGEPFGGAVVRFNDTSSPQDTMAFAELQTDVGGFFSAPVLDSAFSISVATFGFRSDDIEVEFQNQGTQFLQIGMEPLPLSAIQGTIRDQATGDGISATIKLFSSGEVFQQTTTDASGQYIIPDIPISDGETTTYDKIRVESDSPYPTIESVAVIEVQEGQPLIFDVELLPAEVLIVDDDGGDSFEHFYADALDQMETTFFSWDIDARGSARLGINDFPQKPIIWVTGNREQDLITDAELDSLRAHLSRGGSLLLSGQNIAEDLQARQQTFLSDVLHVSFGGQHQVPIAFGVQGDPIGNDLGLIGLAGGDGARNQTSLDILSPIDEKAVVSVVYDTTEGTAAAVRIDEAITGVPSSRVAFFGFGIEAVNNLVPRGGTREQIISASLAWLSGVTSVAEPVAASGSIIDRFELAGNYPNPFNGQTVIRFRVPHHAAGSHVKLKIYDVLGREARTLVDGVLKPGEHRLHWDGRDNTGVALATGLYLYRLEAADFVDMKKMLYVR